VIGKNAIGIRLRRSNFPIPKFQNEVMPAHKKIFFLAVLCGLSLALLSYSSCKVRYGFHEKIPAIPDSIKTVKINTIESHAAFTNAQLGPRLTERLRQKIISQTKLSQTNSDNADWEITAFITDYSVSTSGISDKQVSTNRLNVSVQVTLNRRKQNEQDDPVTISHGFDFDSRKTLQAAENELLDEIIKQMTDEIFNNLFSKW
jgi:hypothetical protein